MIALRPHKQNCVNAGGTHFLASILVGRHKKPLSFSLSLIHDHGDTVLVAHARKNYAFWGSRPSPLSPGFEGLEYNAAI